MKKLALALALIGLFGSAQASGLYVDPTSSVFTINNYNLNPNTTGLETRGVLGNLYASVAGQITFTYLGQESGYSNKFSLNLGGSDGIKSFLDNGNGGLNSTTIGTNIIDNTVNAGLISFWFTDVTNGKSAYNGSNNNGRIGFAFLGNKVGRNFQYDHETTFGYYDYIIGFNDKFKDADYDDLVVGVKFTPNSPSAVPVPAALPLMATALGLFGFGAGRRRI